MAIIKTFKGSGPNPNVPFAGDVPRPQFIGQVELAVDRLGEQITKGALQYQQYQTAQRDAANIADLDAAKMVYQAELDGREDLRDPDGNINVDKYQKELNKFYDHAKINMSNEAYGQWSAKQTVQDGRRISTIMSENMKNTRQANAFKFAESIELMANNSLTGTFQDMQDAMVNIKSSIDNGLATGILTPAQALEAESKIFQKSAKSYLETQMNMAKEAKSEGQVNALMDKAKAFVEADPYGIFGRDSFAKENALNAIATNRLNLSKKLQEDLIKEEYNDVSMANRERRINEDALLNELREMYKDGADAVVPGNYSDVMARAARLYHEGKLDERQYTNIRGFSIRQEKIRNVTLFDDALRDPTNADKYISQMTDKAERDKALVMSLTMERGYESDVDLVRKYAGKENTEALTFYAESTKVFAQMMNDPKFAAMGLTKTDLRAVMGYRYLRMRNPTKFYSDVMMPYSEYVKTLDGSVENVHQRLQEIDSYLSDTILKSRYTERLNRESYDRRLEGL